MTGDCGGRAELLFEALKKGLHTLALRLKMLWDDIFDDILCGVEALNWTDEELADLESLWIASQT